MVFKLMRAIASMFGRHAGVERGRAGCGSCAGDGDLRSLTKCDATSPGSDTLWLLATIVAGCANYALARPLPQMFTGGEVLPLDTGAQNIIVADFDGDGLDDVAAIGSNRVRVHRQVASQSPSGFVDYPTQTLPRAIDCADIDGDGHRDLIVGHALGQLSVLWGLAGGLFEHPQVYAVGTNGNGLAIVDIDNDSRLDLLMGSSNGNEVLVVRNNGNRSLTVANAPPVVFTSGTRAILSLNLNNDALRDIAVLIDGSVKLLENQGGYSFATRATLTLDGYGYSLVAADLNGDGRVDIGVPRSQQTPPSDSFRVFLQLTDGTFVASDVPVGESPESMTAADFDFDGDLDVAIASNGNLFVAVLLNDGQGGFGARVDIPAQARQLRIAHGVFRAGSKADLVVAQANLSSTPPDRLYVLRNRAFPRLHVRASAPSNGTGDTWLNAYRDLRTALTDLQDAPWVRELWVATGTYTPAPPNGPRTASFNLRDDLAVYGGFAGNETSLSQRNITQNPTALSGDLNANDLAGGLNRGDNSKNVVHAEAANNVVLDGFIIRSGNADGIGVPTSGGGILVTAAGSPVIRNTSFIDNIANDMGGGAYVHLGASPIFDRCTFIGNIASQRGGGGLGVRGSGTSARVIDSHFESNIADGAVGPPENGNGGGVFAHENAQVELLRCDFLRNTASQTGGGAGAQFTNSTPARVTAVSCRFLGNTARFGGGVGVSNSAEAVLDGCLVVGNRASGVDAVGGGVALNESGRLRVSNTTIASNHAQARGGGVAVVSSPPNLLIAIYNSLVWHNTSPDDAELAQVSTGAFPSLEIMNCLVQGWTGTTYVAGGILNNADTNPVFSSIPSPGPDGVWGGFDDNYGNLRLTQGSPALDIVSASFDPNLLLPNDTLDMDRDGDTTELLPFDLDGSPRIQNGTVDRGCYEGFRCPVCPNDRQWFSAQSGSWSDDPRWSFSTPTSCLYALLDAAGLPYTITFNNGDAARGLLQSRNTVTLSAPALSNTLTLRPPGIGASCPTGVPQTFRPALLVSGAVLDNPTLNITSGTVNASSGFIAEPFGEVGTINVIGPEAKLTFASGTCSVGDQGEGTLTVQGGATVAAGSIYVGEGDIDSQPDGVFDLHGSIMVDGPGSTLKVKFNLNITHGTVTVRNQGLIDCANTGTVFILPGSSLIGDGTVIGHVLNFGDAGPDDATGATAGAGPFVPKALTISTLPGDPGFAYQQLGTDPKDGPRTGTLRLRTGDNNGAILADSLVINGNAKIAGTLVVEPRGIFAPATNAPAAALLNASTISGRFDLAVFPGIAGDRFMRLSYAAGLGERGAGISVSVAPLPQNIDLDPPSTANVGGVPTDIVAGDFDNDPAHDLDIALTVPDANNPATAPGTVVILKNAGNTGPNGSWAGFTGGQLTFNVGVNPRGLAKGDFNADGVPDLAVANAGSNSLTVLRNLNNGTGAMTTNQTISVGTSPVAVVTGVFRDSSSAIDVAVVNQGSNSVTILNNTAGTLAAAATLSTGDAPSDIAAAHLDSASPTLDLAVTNRDDGTVTIYYRPPAAGFPSLPSRVLPVGPRPVQIEPGGLDNPKEINDLCVTNFGADSTSILLNNNQPGIGPGPGAAGFQPKADLPAGINPGSIALGDLDDDGDPDLSVVTTVNSQRVVRVFRNDVQQVSPGEYQAAFAPFDDAYAGTGPRLVIAGDVNGDGRDDLIAVNDQTLTFRPAPGADSSAVLERVLTDQPNVSTSISLAPNVPAPCPADLVPAAGDNTVNTADLVAFLGQFGRECASLPQGSRCGDFNSDNLVNTADLVTFLGRFGETCR